MLRTMLVFSELGCGEPNCTLAVHMPVFTVCGYFGVQI